MKKSRPVMVWNWDEAPDEFRACSSHGGDEDFVIVVPLEYIDNGGQLEWWPAGMILEKLDFGGDAQYRDLEWTGGRVRVYVTAHA